MKIVMEKVMEHEKLAKSHGILWSVMEFYQFCISFVTTEKFSSDLQGRDGHGKVMENIL